ncbi:universal stress protein [Pseudomonas fluorescens]|uniref:Universal stress protein E n=1 Tax=Pseudomonas fluorescens TaxID=294 RepID=A0A5E7LSH3_PSEFL|nr:universal stress protein [Pseudomonas fluorescens]VVP16376.1 Universal stress protein E [Pseudomonas fluorescens]
MSQYQRLLLIAGPAMRHTPALERAAAIAEATGAALHITVFIEDSHLLGLKSAGARFREVCQQENETWLKDEADLIRGRGVVVSTEVLVTRTALQEILRHVAEMQPDLVIKDVQHESALKRVFITPLDWHLLRECPVPVHLVSEVRCPLPRVVVAAVDPSRPETQITGINDRIIQAANGLSMQCSAELHLLHAYDLSQTHISDAGAGAVTMPGFSNDVRKSLKKSFIALAAHYGVPTERQHFVEGPPGKALADFAAHHRADVIVMGNAHRKGLGKWVGSTTEHVLYQVPCNIFAVTGSADQ